MAGLSEIWVAEGASDPPAPPPPSKFFADVPFFADETFKYAFPERSNQNVHENQQAQLRAS